MPRYLQEWTCVISVLSKNNFISSIFLPEKTMKQVFVKFSVNLLAKNHRTFAFSNSNRVFDKWNSLSDYCVAHTHFKLKLKGTGTGNKYIVNLLTHVRGCSIWLTSYYIVTAIVHSDGDSGGVKKSCDRLLGCHILSKKGRRCLWK